MRQLHVDGREHGFGSGQPISMLPRLHQFPCQLPGELGLTLLRQLLQLASSLSLSLFHSTLLSI
jgi:hypothetical protein